MSLLDELAQPTYEMEACITSEIKPIVLDAGSMFYDKYNKHSNSCGWLSIHAAIHFATFCAQNVPADLTMLLHSYKLLPTKLKIKSGEYGLNTRIKDENIRVLAKKLNIQILVWEFGQPNAFNEAGSKRLTINLWLSMAHYCVLLQTKEEQIRAREFVGLFPKFGYSVYQLDPAGDEKSSEEIARLLQAEEIALAIQSDEYAHAKQADEIAKQEMEQLDIDIAIQLSLLL